jgi:hypothetical protein
MGLEAASVRIATRWFPGGHSTYFTPWNIERTFEQIYEDILEVQSPKSKVQSRGPAGSEVESQGCQLTI